MGVCEDVFASGGGGVGKCVTPVLGVPIDFDIEDGKLYEIGNTREGLERSAPECVASDIAILESGWVDEVDSVPDACAYC